MRFEVDSGAAVTIVSIRTAQKYVSLSKLESTSLQLITFCKTQIQIVGVISVTVSELGANTKLNMYVSKIDREPLLGREWIRQLRIRLTDEIYTITTPYSRTEDRIKDLLRKYQNRLDPRSTKIRGLQAKLTVKENVNPVFRKARAVSFKLVSLVEQEPQSLVQQGVLEKVSTAKWAAPIVPVLKRNNTVRICGDFSVTLNPNLQIDEHPLPTIDELFAMLAGGGEEVYKDRFTAGLFTIGNSRRRSRITDVKHTLRSLPKYPINVWNCFGAGNLAAGDGVFSTRYTWGVRFPR